MARLGRGLGGGRVGGARHAAALLAAAGDRGHRGLRLAVAGRADAAQRLLARAGPGARAISPSAPTGSSKPSMSRRPTSPCSARRSSPAWRSCWASFPGSPPWVSRRIIDRWPDLAGRYSRLVVLAIAWTVAEWLRGHLFTGYPWNPSAHVWGFATPLLQGAALFGVYGLGMLTFLVLAAPTAGWRASIAALLVVGPRGLGRPVGDGRHRQRQAGPWIRIVQPNVPQAQKWRPETRSQQLAKLVRDEPRAGLRSPGRRGLARDGAAVDHRAQIGSACGHGPGRAAGRPIC